MHVSRDREVRLNLIRPMLLIAAATVALVRPVHAQLDKDHRALIERGLETHGQKLGAALVLKDVLFIPGQHMDGAGNIVNNPVPIGMGGYPSGYNAAAKDPWFRGVHTI